MYRTTIRGGRTGGPLRRVLAGLTAVSLAALATALAAAAPASAADAVTVSDVSLAWGLDATASAGAYYGGCNFLSAGAAGDTGSSSLWTATTPDPGYATQVGNVTIEKPTSGGGWAQPTWSTKCQDANGTAVTTTTSTGTRVEFAAGTGTVDPDAGAASISWTGAFTSVFYGGLVYWSASDPTLTVNTDGTGTLTATLSGYGADMTDSSKWVTLPPTVATLATLSGVAVTATGITLTPDYHGITVDVPEGGNAQYQSGDYWGSWPQSFVDFQDLTGESSYWYSTNLNDQDKVALPIVVGYSTGDQAPTYHPTLTVTPDTGLSDGGTITVSGSGYDAATPNPHGTGDAGAYVELGWILPGGWQPSGGAPASARSSAAAIWVHSTPTAGASNEALLNDDGSFQVTFTIDTSALAAQQIQGGQLAVFTVGAGGLVNAGEEAEAPITLAAATPPPSGDQQQTITATVPAQAGSFTWTIDATDHEVTLSDAIDKGAYFESTGSLLPVTVTDTRAGGPAWSISGQISDFTAGLSGKYLGWTPTVTTPGAGATAGTPVTPGFDTGNGLTDAAMLAAATDGHDAGSATVGAALDLQIPATTPAGTYTATLTLTALS